MLRQGIKNMASPLPSVISSIASNVANVVNSIQPVAKPNEALRTLVLISKDLSDVDLAEFKNFGDVLVWKAAWKNIPYAQLQAFDYLIVDMRLPEARQQLKREDMSQFQVVHYVSWVQRLDDYLQQVPWNILTSIPPSASSKSDFDQQLLNQPLVEPSLLVSIFRFFVACGSK